MGTTFPSAVDAFVNPLPTQLLSSPSHSGQHSDANDAIEALEAILVGRPWFNVKAYGAVGNGATDDTAAIQAAINAASALGGAIVLLPTGTYLVTNTLTLPKEVWISGAGVGATVISHTANGTCIKHENDADYTTRTGISDLRIDGNVGAAAVGIQASDSFGFELRRVQIQNYSAGIGLLLQNSNSWTEGTLLYDLSVRGCLRGIALNRTGGTDSFGYAKWLAVSINVNVASGIGIDFGYTGGAIYAYNGFFVANIWLEAANAIAIRVDDQANVIQNFGHFVGEAIGAAGSIAIKNDGGNFRIMGRIFFPSVTTLTSGAGSTRVMSGYGNVDTASGNDGAGNSYRIALAEDPDTTYLGSLAWRVGTNISSPVMGMYEATGNDFRLLRMPFGGTLTSTSATLIFRVDSGGVVYPSNGATSGLHAGSGVPNNANGANGDYYFRQDTPGTANQRIYVKAAGAWAGIV